MSVLSPTLDQVFFEGVRSVRTVTMTPLYINRNLVSLSYRAAELTEEGSEHWRKTILGLFTAWLLSALY